MTRSLLAVLALAVTLRALRVIARWDELALAYAAYAEPAVRALAAGDLLTAATIWIGLHPPLFGLLHGLSSLLWPAPLTWLVLGAALSTAAVAGVGRAAGPLAALVLATAPGQLADAAEVNNYPLAAAAVAVVLATAGARWHLLAIAAVLAGWSHVLAGAAAVGVVLWRFAGAPRRGWRLLAAVALGLLPIAAGALRLVGADTTFVQPPTDAAAWIAMIAEAVGPVGLVLGVVGLAGLRGAALAAWAPMAITLGFSLLSGAAATHQRPYLAILGVPLAVGVAHALRGRRTLTGLAVGLCLLQGAQRAHQGALQVSELANDQQRERAIDRAIAGSVPGDLLWLVAPALTADDDKTDTSAVLWRLRPWEAMPIARPVAFEYTDWRYGQPRTWRGRTVHTSTELDDAVFDHVAAEALDRGAAIHVVLYEHGPATGLVQRVERTLRPYTWRLETLPGMPGLGDDRLYTIGGIAP